MPYSPVIHKRPKAWLAAAAERHDGSRSGAGRTAVKVGDRAPDFEALDQHGNTLALRDLLDSGPVVVYFYSKAMTPG